MAETEWIGAAEVARRLGIKQATLYSYVSRGVLSRRRAGGGAGGGGGKGSLFDAGEVEELARRGRPRRPPGLAGLVIESGVTEIAGDQLRFRGLDALDLARDWSFEDVCELLWLGQPAPSTQAVPPPRAGPFPAGGHGAVAGDTRGGRGRHGGPGGAPGGHLPPGTAAGDRPGAGRGGPAAAPVRPAGRGRGGPGHHRGPGGVPAARRRGGPPPGTGRRPPGRIRRPSREDPAASGIAARLWPRLCPDEPSPGLLDALRAALVLLADHELAASTLAARVAASVRADPYAVVATGLGAVGGALHGGASLGAETMLAAAQDAAGVPRVVGELLRRGERVPGFGHFVYRGGDPRAGLLLALVRSAVPASPRLAVVDAVLAEMHRRALPEPNIDFALAVLATCAGMIRGAGEVIFAVARTAGWLAHALEEYTASTPLRPRAVYTGAADRQADPGQR